MYKFSCDTVANAPPSGMYATMLDVRSFDEFIPWVQSARVDHEETGPDGEIVEGSILVSLRTFSGWVSARVNADQKNNTILVKMTKGPFQIAKATFHFEPASDDRSEIEQTRVTVDVEYATPLAIYRSLIDKHRKRGFEQVVSLFARRHAEAA